MTDETPKSAESPLEQIAIITYNIIGGGGYKNGWLEYPGKKALIVQNKDGARIGLPLWMLFTNPKATEICKTKMEDLFEGITSTLKQMNQIYVYVGLGGANDAIRLTKDLPPQKLSYVLCDCNYRQKINLISEIGNNHAKLIKCECGGWDTLDKILKDFIGNKNK